MDRKLAWAWVLGSAGAVVALDIARVALGGTTGTWLHDSAQLGAALVCLHLPLWVVGSGGRVGRRVGVVQLGVALMAGLLAMRIARATDVPQAVALLVAVGWLSRTLAPRLVALLGTDSREDAQLEDVLVARGLWPAPVQLLAVQSGEPAGPWLSTGGGEVLVVDAGPCTSPVELGAAVVRASGRAPVQVAVATGAVVLGIGAAAGQGADLASPAGLVSSLLTWELVVAFAVLAMRALGLRSVAAELAVWLGFAGLRVHRTHPVALGWWVPLQRWTGATSTDPVPTA